MTKALGAFGEAWAAGYLVRNGYQILERNVRFRDGEIDIVAHEGADLVFVEVKCRRSYAFGAPQESITATRFARLERAVQHYLSVQATDPESYRVDVVALVVDARGSVTSCEIFKGVESPGR